MNTEKNTNLPLIIWVSSLLILLFILVLVGGATRITDSGLSITEWEVLIGILPPLSESSWFIEFEKYKKHRIGESETKLMGVDFSVWYLDTLRSYT